MNFHHKSVLLNEVIEALEVKSDGIYIDCTLGGGGHAATLGAKLSPAGLLVGIDQDEDAIRAANQRLTNLSCRVKIIHGNFSDIDKILNELDIDKVDGIIFDLGVSSHQIDTAERGFSYMHNAPLDMRMDRRRKLSARDVINFYDEDQLAKMFHEFGEERFSKRVAYSICKARKIAPIETTGELVKIIEQNIPRTKNGGHPAKRIFQAIRIEVNGELEILSAALKESVKHLKDGGRLAVITFHSLEDRIVKETFKSLARGCICPKNFPVCVCDHRPTIKIIGKVVKPASNEIELNSRAKSAKLRIVEKISA